MDHQSFMQSLRLRTHQFLTWFLGSTQTQQQSTQRDRHQQDGVLRGLEDPDARQRHALGQDAGLSLRDRFQAWGGSQGSQADTQARQQHGLAQHHREQQHRQQRGGWGHGR
jgi:hypothetical protein